MRTQNHNIRTGLIALLALALPGMAMADEEVTEVVTRNFETRVGQVIDLENLAGRLEVVGTSGRTLSITATVVAGGDDEEEARELLEMMDLTAQESGGRIEIRANYPVDEITSYHYRSSEQRWGGNSNTTTRFQGHRVRVSSNRRGADLHVDFVLRVPEGVDLRAENVVGMVTLEGVMADAAVSTANGSIRSENGAGRVRYDTGSGSVEVHGHTGEVVADTGSGRVLIEDVDGDVNADTGSGHVELYRIRAERISADTGSGGVEMRDVTGSMLVDTGSGRVEADGFIAGDRVEIDTGSGGVDLRGDLSGVRELNIDTGSGGVRIRTSHAPRWGVEVETGSGGINVDLPGIERARSRPDYFYGVVNGGEGHARIDTGSGGVRISMD
jgi:DUF4097 and DUF4098 domain-containing protein YvlB